MSRSPVSRTRILVVSALFSALIAASSLIAVPVGEVPFTLQTLAVVLAALILPPAGALGAVGIYVLAGVVGVPVFAGAKAGLAVLVGPTGGFLVGFIAGAWAGSAIRVLLRLRTSVLIADISAAVVVIAVTYTCGWLQLSIVTGMGAGPAAVAGVLPFIGPDVLKAAGAIVMAGVLRRAQIV